MILIKTMAIFLLSFSVYAKTDFLDALSVRTGLNSVVKESETEKVRVIGFVIGAKGAQKLDDGLYLRFDIDGIFQDGSSQVNGLVSEYEPQQELSLNYGHLDYRPFSFARIKVGALDQGNYDSDLLVGSTSFAAIEETVKFGKYVYIRSEQAIPSNSQLNRRAGSIDEGTPIFYFHTFGLRAFKQNKFKLELSHFKFEDLSSSIANTSRSLGNSVKGTDENSQFLYGFEGTNLVISQLFKFYTDYSLKFDLQAIYNDKAPNERNTGYLAKVAFGTGKYTFLLESFRNESDSSPAYYNSKTYGHNNTKGSGIGIEYATNSTLISTKYLKVNLIEESQVQSAGELLTFSVVKTYEF